MLRMRTLMGAAALCLAAMVTANAADDGTPGWHVDDHATLTLRGFGALTLAPLAVPGATGWQWQCESPERAAVWLHKFGRDLQQSATAPAAWQTIALGGQQVPVLVRPGFGSFLPLAQAQQVLVFTSDRTDDLPAAFAAAVPQLAGARFFDPAFRYPKYLDKFSHYGIGSWYPYAWGDDTPKGTPNEVNTHYAFARQLDLAIQPNNGGLLLRNLLPKLHEFDRPYHFAQWQQWDASLALLDPASLIQPNAQFTVRPSYYGQVSLGGTRLLTYRNWDFQQHVVKEYAGDPLLVDWLDPNGEVGPFANEFYWDNSENNRLQMVRYLRDIRHYTLPQLGQAWYGAPGKFTSWEQVPIPMDPTLYGWQPGCLQADPSWSLHSASLAAGLAAGYAKDDCDTSGWPAFTIPGGERSAMAWTKNTQKWYRGTLTVPAEWLTTASAKGRIYLNAITLTQTGGWKNPERLWLNGQELATFSECPGHEMAVQVDVTGLLRAGRNTLAFLPCNPSNGLAGPLFLTSEKWTEYPWADSQRNARYSDWRNYISWAVMDLMEDTYKAIRGVDPDRYIKMHAYEDKALGIPLQAKYGGFGHNTGEGGFFRPWDRRFGYSYGVPGSAEFGGYVNTVPGLKRWLGWFTFEGLNAFDNFHNLQEMMYAVNKDVWTEYMPYLKLAPRRDMKRPDIALLWSSANNHLLLRPVPYCFDLGRGDLQSIGYSYVDMSETGLADGKAQAYPVLWDTGTWIMSRETVTQVRQYVEAGGTFVALQETGRHTYTERDAWPISELTGCKVREVRPMSGTVAVLHEQSLLKKLAGKTFYNRGKAIDYSDYNYADQCIALDPVAPGVEVLARYSDGAAAITLRHVGKGRVIVLGSPFWRDSYDGAGMWWPGEGQSLFLEDVLAGLGLKPLASADTHDVWREHYLANNGTEEYLCLWNPFDTPRTFTTDWTTVHPATALYDPKNGQPIAGTITGNTVHLEKVTLAPLETLIVASQVRRPPADAVKAWFDHLALWSRPSAPGVVLQRPDLPVYELKLTLDLKAKAMSASELAPGKPAELSKLADPGAGYVRGGSQSYEEYKTQPDAQRRVVFHVPVTVPPSWRAGDRIHLQVRAFSHAIGNVVGPVDAWCNGQQVLTQANCSAQGYEAKDGGGGEVDLAPVLNLKGPNALVMVTGPNGFIGEVVITCQPQPAETLEVTGDWQVQTDEDHGLKAAPLPGTFTGIFATKTDVTVPAAWQGSRVFLRLDVGAGFGLAGINDRVVFHDMWSGEPTLVDVTPWVKFGAANSLTVLTKDGMQKWSPGTLVVKHITLERVTGR